MTLDEGYDIALVALACDDMHKDARMALGRIIDSRQDALERAERAEAEVAKLKAELAAKEVANG